ncbi:unnamed protein product [Larinioides sclopetarius]|uniref:DNA damage-binding protein 1 n=1 Tax=Larinioides sclopetarius TaxID=280406 RepID=A0AAV2C088_9ARAC
MFFYHRTLSHALSITGALIGNFLDGKKEDIIVSTGRILKLLRFELDDTGPVIQTLTSVDTYDIIISLAKFRNKDEARDWIVIAADSGNTTIFNVNAEKMEFESVIYHHFIVQIPKRLPIEHLAVDSQGRAIFSESNLQDKFKDKISRTLPVHHMAVDTKGRAVFIAAMEELKQIWFPFGSGRLLKILEDVDKKTLIYDIAFVDINSENIVIAYLATAYEELHAGLKYEIKKRRKPSLIFANVDSDEVTKIGKMECLDYANSLISVPGERGVLVCAEDSIAFYSMDSSTIIRCSIPKRIMDPKAGVIFVCSTKCSRNLFQNPNQKDESSSFFPSTQNSIYYLAQTEQGDIFRIQLVVNEFGVNEIVLKYFITLPVASALCTFESGFLFVASEFGNHYVYNIADIENRARVHPSFSSALPKGKPFLFMHRSLTITPVAEIQSLSPIMHMEFEPLASMRYRLCLAMGRASLSALKISKVEQDVTYQNRAKIEKERDEIPVRMWIIESTLSISEESEMLIVVSFEDSTSVYSLDGTSEYIMQKIESTPFAEKTNTLGCAKTGEDAIIQVCPKGVCLITDKKNKLIHRTEEKDAIEECAMNKKSLVIAFENKQLKHHEIDKDGRVMKSKIPRRLINGPVTCMLLSDKSESDQLLAVGVSIPPVKTSDSKVMASVNEVHLFNIGLSEIKLLCMLKVENSPYSFLFMNGESNLLSLLVGCEKGRLLTLAVEKTAEAEGTIKHELKISNTETIGSEAVQLLHVPVLTNAEIGYGILAVSNHPWFKESLVGDFFQLKSDISPCICIIPKSENIATILEDQLRIFILEDLQPKLPVTFSLEYTPKKFAVDSYTGNIFIIETDNNSYTEETKEKKEIEFRMHVEAAKSQQRTNLPPLENIPKSWASLLRAINLTGVNAREVFKIPFDQNEAALSLCYFQQGGDDLLLVGVAKGFKIETVCCKEASIYTYKILEDGETISFLHKTEIKSAPLAMCCYDGNVLIGIGRKLALYCVAPESLELKLLCEKKDCVSNSVTAIYPVDRRILVSDSKFGLSYLMYVPSDKSLYLLQEDVFPAEVTAACILRDNKMVRATKSRDIFIVELGTLKDRDMSKVINDDEPPFTLSKEELLGCFHVGEVVTSMQIFNTFPNEPDTVVYTTLSGSIGGLSLLPWEKDAKKFNNLYETMLKLAPIIDKKRNTFPFSPNVWFRSRHYKRKNEIDGDFHDEFLRLKEELPKIEWMKLEEDVTQISTKLERMRRDSMLSFQF